MENTLRRRLTGRHLIAGLTLLLALTALCAPLIRGQVREEAPKLLFTAEFEGLEAGRFHQVSGLSIEVEVIEFSEGGINIIRKLPGRAKYPNVVLKRGFTGDLALYNWANAKVLTGDVIRRSGVITMYNQASGEVVARYHIEDAWPTKWTGPTLQGSKNEVAIETLEIAHVGFKREVD